MSRIEKGEIVVKHPVLATQIEKAFAPRIDFTKEAIV
jgi:hypothetical protein